MTRRRLFAGVAAVLLVAVAFVAGRGARHRANLLNPQRRVATRDLVRDVSPLADLVFHDGLGRELHAWYHVGTRGNLVLVHGFGEHRGQLAPEMKLLVSAGYGFLAYDAPGHGESAGDATWADERDQAALRAGVDALIGLPGVDPDRVGALGFSVGGATVALGAAKDARIRVVVLEGAFPSLYDEMLSDCGRWSHLCAYPGAIVTRRAGIDVEAVRPIDAMPLLAPRPVLVVTDTVLPLDHAMQLANFDAAREPKELYEVPGALHGEYSTVDPDGYRTRLLGFLDRHLGIDSAQ